MDVKELLSATFWVEHNIKNSDWSYVEELQRVLDHNSQNNSKQSLKDELSSVHRYFTSMQTDQLTLQQQSLFHDNGILDLIGENGWKEVERVVKGQDAYDPGSAAQDFRSIKDRLHTFFEEMIALQRSLQTAKIDAYLSNELEDDKVRIDVHFRDEASITDITKLRHWSDEWFHIMRNFAVAAGEAPEDVKVVGAGTGSIIICLMGTLTVAKVVAITLKYIAEGVDQIYFMKNSTEDFRMKKVLNAKIEKVLIDSEKEIAKNTKDKAISAIIEHLKPQNGEVTTQITQAVDKLFSFSALGGLIDMITPENEDATDQQNQDIADINNAVSEVRKLSAAARRLLSYSPEGDAGTEAPKP